MKDDFSGLKLTWLLLVVAAGLLMAMSLSAPPAHESEPAGGDPSPTAALPPRPTFTPTPIPTSTPTPVPSPTPTAIPTATNTPIPPYFARIQLLVGPEWEGAWTVVQWPGADGIWHDIDGWSGEVSNGSVRWWVAPRHLGSSPFRWQIYAMKDGEALFTSEEFGLPKSGTEIVKVDLR